MDEDEVIIPPKADRSIDATRLFAFLNQQEFPANGLELSSAAEKAGESREMTEFLASLPGKPESPNDVLQHLSRFQTPTANFKLDTEDAYRGYDALTIEELRGENDGS